MKKKKNKIITTTRERKWTLFYSVVLGTPETRSSRSACQVCQPEYFINFDKITSQRFVRHRRGRLSRCILYWTCKLHSKGLPVDFAESVCADTINGWKNIEITPQSSAGARRDRRHIGTVFVSNRQTSNFLCTRPETVRRDFSHRAVVSAPWFTTSAHACVDRGPLKKKTKNKKQHNNTRYIYVHTCICIRTVHGAMTTWNMFATR